MPGERRLDHRAVQRLGRGSTVSIPIETLLLLRSLKETTNEAERKAIRVALLDVFHESRSSEERDAITEALLDV